MLTFDAIAGNNDRHFYNWGVIDTKKKTSKLPTFAPIYDSARGLLWNYSDENIKKIHKNGSKKILTYIEDACPRISIESNTQANHFQLINFIKKYNFEYEQIVNEISSVENEKRVIQMLKKEFFQFYIPERCDLITGIIKTRFLRIREI